VYPRDYSLRKRDRKSCNPERLAFSSFYDRHQERGALMGDPRRRFNPQRELVKQPIMMTQEGVLIPPDPDDTFERLCRDMTLHLDCLPSEYPELADPGGAALHQQGRQALAADPAQVDRALQSFQTVVRRYPCYWPAVNNLGLVTELQGAAHLEAAGDYYREAINGSLAMLAGEMEREAAATTEPVTEEHLALSLAAAYLNLGGLLRTRGNYETTLAYHEAALDLLRRSLAVTDPRRTQPKHTRLVVIAACLHELGQREEARQSLQHAYELDRHHWYCKREHNCRSFPALSALIQTIDKR
jgi:tetratricopeptide (TPR) repeat protein